MEVTEERCIVEIVTSSLFCWLVFGFGYFVFSDVYQGYLAQELLGIALSISHLPRRATISGFYTGSMDLNSDLSSPLSTVPSSQLHVKVSIRNRHSGQKAKHNS